MVSRTPIVTLLTAWLLWSAVAIPAAGEAPLGREIVINLPAFRLYLYEHGTLIRDYPIAIGSIVEQQTVLGTTRIINRVVDPTYYPRDRWRREGVEPIPPGPDNPVGTRWLGLDIPHYGIHGTNQPSSIGSPASAGCIRMYNEDVEELTGLVRVGTPVHIVYETVLVEGADPLLGDWRLRIHPDLYDRGTNRLGRVRERLQASGIDLAQVSDAGLQALLEEADGLPHPLPRPHRVTVNGDATDIEAFRLHDRVYAAAAPLAARVGESARWSPRRRVGVVAGEVLRTGKVVQAEYYAPLPDLARILRMGLHPDEHESGPTFVQVRWGREVLALRAYREQWWLMLPLEPLAQRAGRGVAWDGERGTPLLDGVPVFGGTRLGNYTYFPHHRLESLLSVRVDWEPESSQAIINAP